MNIGLVCYFTNLTPLLENITSVWKTSILPRCKIYCHQILLKTYSAAIVRNMRHYLSKSRKENPQKLTQLNSRSHPRHLVGKRTAQKTPL